MYQSFQLLNVKVHDLKCHLEVRIGIMKSTFVSQTKHWDPDRVTKRQARSQENTHTWKSIEIMTFTKAFLEIMNISFRERTYPVERSTGSGPEESQLTVFNELLMRPLLRLAGDPVRNVRRHLPIHPRTQIPLTLKTRFYLILILSCCSKTKVRTV